MGGRLPKLLPDEKTVSTIENLGKIQATNAEAAAVLGVSRETFEKFLGNNKTVADAFENAKGSGKTSLRRAQFKAALDGNATMLVWLGKQLLDQRDKHEIDQTTNVNVTVNHVRDGISRKLARIASLQETGGLASQPVAGRA